MAFQNTKIYLDTLGIGGKDLSSDSGWGTDFNFYYQYKRSENFKFGLMVGYGELRGEHIVSDFSLWDDEKKYDLRIESELKMIKFKVFLEYNFWDNLNIAAGVSKNNLFSSSELRYINIEDGTEIDVRDEYFEAPNDDATKFGEDRGSELNFLANSLMAMDFALSYDFNFEVDKPKLAISPELGSVLYFTEFIQKGDWSINTLYFGMNIKLMF